MLCFQGDEAYQHARHLPIATVSALYVEALLSLREEWPLLDRG